ncbi:superinfection immunity protein [Chloroflexota bacterium]
MFSFVWIISIIFGIAIFLLPTIVAIVGHKKNTTAILVLNLLGGLTVVGWVVALIWAITSARQES